MTDEPALSKRKSLPRYERADDVQAWNPTPRDLAIVEAVHKFDDMLADYQVMRLFSMGKTQAQLRTRLLYQHHWLDRPSKVQRAGIPAMTYWLGKNGVAYLAGLEHLPIKEFKYRQHPHWQNVAHDLLVNDIRISVIQACKQIAGLELETWISELEFWRYPRDKVLSTTEQGRKKIREVRPDGLFSIRNTSSLYRWRFLLEVDRSTEDNVSMGEDKILPGITYLVSDAYRKRCLVAETDKRPGGRWLYITTTERRLRNMKQKAKMLTGNHARAFYFTTFDAANDPSTIFTQPIWQRGDDNTLHILLEK